MARPCYTALFQHGEQRQRTLYCIQYFEGMGRDYHLGADIVRDEDGTLAKSGWLVDLLVFVQACKVGQSRSKTDFFLPL